MHLTDALAAALKLNMPEETILVTPTLGEGRRLLQMVASAGHLIVGARVATPGTLAQEICAEDLCEEDALRLMENTEAQDLMFRTLRNMPQEGFFAGEHAKDRKTAELMYGVISELAVNEVGTVGGNERQDAVQQLREAYQVAKKQGKLLDNTDILKMAVEKAKEYYAEKKPYFVTLSTYQFKGLEKALLNATAGIDLNVVPVMVPDTIPVPSECVGENHTFSSVNTENVRFVSCRGVETEERFIMRDILEHNRLAEDCAVVYMSSDYAAGLYTEAQLFHIPITISGGIPLTGSLIYLALNMLADWKVSDYDAEQLRTLILSGAVSIPFAGTFAGRLRDKNIGWGEDRYTGRFLTVTEDEKYPPEAETLSVWKDFIDTILQIAKMEGSQEEQKSVLAHLLNGYIAVRSSAEGSALKSTVNLLRSISWLDEGESVLGRLLELMGEASYMTGHEEPGKLFAVPLASAFCTGRKVLYVCGMSRFCMQGSRQESPLLLDEEKRMYGLRTMLEREQENTFRLNLMLLQHEGEVIMSYCDYDTERMIELQPAPAYRELADGKQSEKITYIPQKAVMLGDLEGSGAYTQLSEMNSSNPDENTEAAKLAPEEKYSDQFGRMTFSPTSLEEALACPLKFYLKRMLGLIPEKLPERNNDAWLDAAEMGSLCHAVLERYYAGKGSLEYIFEEELDKIKDERPVARDSAVKADRDRAWTMVNRAIRWTEDEGHQVISTEKAFGRKAEKAPLQLTIGGRTIGLSGSIDRVDRLPDGTIAVLDYKTGTSRYYKENEAIKLQPYLYARAMEQLDADIHVTDSGYLFLKDTADYFKVSQTDSARALKEKIIVSLLDWMKDEDRAETAAPAFVILEGSGIEGTGSSGEREDKYKSCREYCEYAGFCLAGEQINAARALEFSEEDEDE